jgi:ribosomal-protein-alanine N-acetyltransferase
VKIRLGEPSDGATIERIARASFDRVYAFFATRGARRADFLLVAEEDVSILGFVEGNVFRGSPPVGYIYFVATDPAHRGKGIGRALVFAALRELEQRGATQAFAAVPQENEASMRLFSSLGFQQVPRRMLRKWYGWRGFPLEIRMMLAPHEVLLIRTFTDPSPASPDDVPRP